MSSKECPEMSGSVSSDSDGNDDVVSEVVEVSTDDMVETEDADVTDVEIGQPSVLKELLLSGSSSD